MIANVSDSSIQSLEILEERLIEAPLELTFEAILEQVGPRFETAGPCPMVLEAWPGGRWYRDLGDGAGHFWGHVQVIKPPTLLEICGPLCMSYPATNHVQYRLTAQGDRTLLQFAHRGIGHIADHHREGMSGGWCQMIRRILQAAETRQAGQETK